jgi:hypothetical protein
MQAHMKICHMFKPHLGNGKAALLICVINQINGDGFEKRSRFEVRKC